MNITYKFMKLSALTATRERIHLNPAWQRGPVWSQPKQSLLIDSILRGYNIPMIYLRSTPKNSPHDFEVVDGQQRLRAIWGFMDGAFALAKELEKFGALDASGKPFSGLPPRMQAQISEVVLVTAIVRSAREPEISRLFSRMQMGVRLNPPELRNAVQTPLRHAIDGVAREDPFFKASKIQSARLRRQDYLAHAFSICFHDAQVDLKAPQLMADYESLTKPAKFRSLIGKLQDILEFLHVVNKLSSMRLTQKWMFVDLVYLLYKSPKALARIEPGRFAAVYVEFDRDRLKHNSAPQNLLEGKPTGREIDLYNYIQSFKLSAGSRKSLTARHDVLSKRFAKEFR